MQVQFQKLRANAVLPSYMTEGAAGLDLVAAMEHPISLDPGGRTGVPTGLAMALPVGFEAQIRPRSGLARDKGVTVANAPGTIDADYRGEIIVLLINLGTLPVVIEPGHRIAQMVISPVTRASLVEVTTLSQTARGDGGFGSTGH